MRCNDTWVETIRVCQYVMKQHGEWTWIGQLERKRAVRVGEDCDKGTVATRRSSDLHHCYEPQHVQLAAGRAFTGASSSSACVAHVGVLTEERKTLSRFFNSFSRSIMSFFVMIDVISESKSVPMPREYCFSVWNGGGKRKTNQSHLWRRLRRVPCLYAGPTPLHPYLTRLRRLRSSCCYSFP